MRKARDKLTRPPVVELIAQGSPSSLLFFKRPNGAIDFLDGSPVQKRFVKRLFSGLAVAKSLVESNSIFGADNGGGHSPECYSVSTHCATLALEKNVGTKLKVHLPEASEGAFIPPD